MSRLSIVCGHALLTRVLRFSYCLILGSDQRSPHLGGGPPPRRHVVFQLCSNKGVVLERYFCRGMLHGQRWWFPKPALQIIHEDGLQSLNFHFLLALRIHLGLMGQAPALHNEMHQPRRNGMQSCNEMPSATRRNLQVLA
jgi:hypothetical protein